MVLTKKKLDEIVAVGCVQNREKDVVIDTVSICLHLDNQFTEYAPYGGGSIYTTKNDGDDH